MGDTEKEDIRAEAAKAGIPTATKKDSQGVCFLGHIDIPEFLTHYIDLKSGDVLIEQGEVIGTHQGALVYTFGQRHGFTLDNKDTDRKHHYVVARDIDKNSLTVSEARKVTEKNGVVTLASVGLRSLLVIGDTLKAQFRYRQTPFEVTVASQDNDNLTLSVLEPTEQPAAGQSCVLYRGSHCIGGGILT